MMTALSSDERIQTPFSSDTGEKKQRTNFTACSQRADESTVWPHANIALLCEQREALRTHIRRQREQARCLRRRQRQSRRVLELALKSREKRFYRLGVVAGESDA